MVSTLGNIESSRKSTILRCMQNRSAYSWRSVSTFTNLGSMDVSCAYIVLEKGPHFQFILNREERFRQSINGSQGWVPSSSSYASLRALFFECRPRAKSLAIPHSRTETRCCQGSSITPRLKRLDKLHLTGGEHCKPLVEVIDHYILFISLEI